MNTTSNNHTKSADDYKALDQLYLPHWLAERICTVNYDLVEHILQLLPSNNGFSSIYGVDRESINHLHHNASSLRSLLGTPVLMLSPTLTSVEDWRCFVDDTPTTLAVDVLRNSMPPTRDGLTRLTIQHHNRQYLDIVQAVANMSVLAVPLLGMPPELVRYLGNLPSGKLRRALERIRDLPLFQWRFRSQAFWFEFTAHDLNVEQVAHHIMATTPFRAGDLPHSATWTDLRLGRETHETYAAALMAHGGRASTAATLFRLPQSKTRQMYQTIHGKRSPCGNLPNSLQWFVDKPGHRLHSTLFIWLFSAALEMNANTPQALIAACDLYSNLFKKGALLTADRACGLTRWMGAGTRLSIAPCRECQTHYIVSNNESKIEMHHSFICPACTGSLVPRVRGAGRNRRRNANAAGK
ncbi:FlhC family transcriptional regulator [Paraburkholderia sp. CNPSo 3076]|uniref:FlhC family transcriptional regulator n=1 Tax=Paraburkholderia sp. CNPSo 3076 TaxID=2940936 RepID=UPI002250364A|nr:FlhC family transcriptional regulator [Paraburkholderia sp. CNPSo 3076]MCX5544661.1 FlhC family transcriptional regulator [Paraburkholderia sp. CNPSo 3076]